MPVQVIYYLLILWLCTLLLYGCYKVIWYSIKMVSLHLFIKRLSRINVTVEQRRGGMRDVVFGKKGMVDYIITYQDKRYEVSVLSKISTHGRWNIEKNRARYYLESRRSSKIFYNRYVNSSAPDHVAEYKNELRLSRNELHMSPFDPTYDGQIYLLYPYPKCITYTDAHYNELFVGDRVEGHLIMDIHAFKELFSNKS